MKSWCQVRVLKNGRIDWPYEYVCVAAKIGDFFGGMTRNVRTDDRGIAIIEWSSNNDLEKIYVSGQTFYGPFENGRSYTLNYRI